eukprot:symbB.v1.2.026749.t1/scaffold2615.1/size144827/2
MLLAKHLSAYDPQVRFSSSSSKESKSSRPLPQMAVVIKQVSVRLWQSEVPDIEDAKMQLHLHMLELSTVKNLVLEGADAEVVLRLKLKGLIGHNSTRAGGRSVYLCSALEGNLGHSRNALELTANWTSERKRIVLVTMEFHFSPTQGLVDTWHLLKPLMSSKGGENSEAVPEEYKQGDARPVDGSKVQSQVSLVIQDVDLHLHFGSAEYGAALALSEGLQEACAGRPCALRVCARLTILEAEALRVPLKEEIPDLGTIMASAFSHSF